MAVALALRVMVGERLRLAMWEGLWVELKEGEEVALEVPVQDPDREAEADREAVAVGDSPRL